MNDIKNKNTVIGSLADAVIKYDALKNSATEISKELFYESLEDFLLKYKNLRKDN